MARSVVDWAYWKPTKSGEPVFDVEDRVWFAMDLACGVHVTCEVAWAVMEATRACNCSGTAEERIGQSSMGLPFAVLPSLDV